LIVTETTSRFRAAAVSAAVAAWALVAVGGIVRASASGLGCPDWPLCHGRPIPKSTRTSVIEFSHRGTAAIVTALVVLVAIMAWRNYRSRRDIVVPALAALCLVPLQALLGAIVVWLELPSWIVGLHFVVGMVFMGTTVVVAAAAFRSREPRATPEFATLTAWTFAAVSALVVAGAVVVSKHADVACGEQWPLCNGTFVSGGGDATAQVVHRLLAYTVAGLTLALAVQAWRGRGPRVLGTLPLLAALGQMTIGILLVVSGDLSRAHEPLGALHVAGAGTVWALIITLAVTVARPRAADLHPRAKVTAGRRTMTGLIERGDT
jgi:heme A synthase